MGLGFGLCGLFKNVRFGGGQRIQVRLEAFNVFNQAHFNNPSGAIGTANFGRITAAADGRVFNWGSTVLNPDGLLVIHRRVEIRGLSFWFSKNSVLGVHTVIMTRQTVLAFFFCAAATVAGSATPPPAGGRGQRPAPDPKASTFAKPSADNRTLTAVEGIKVGHFTLAERPTGCTVVLAKDGTVGGVDVRGGRPARAKPICSTR